MLVISSFIDNCLLWL